MRPLLLKGVLLPCSRLRSWGMLLQRVKEYKAQIQSSHLLAFIFQRGVPKLDVTWPMTVVILTPWMRTDCAASRAPSNTSAMPRRRSRRSWPRREHRVRSARRATRARGPWTFSPNFAGVGRASRPSRIRSTDYSSHCHTVTSWCRFGVAANESLPFLRCLVANAVLASSSFRNAKVGSHS